jgi:hypothetical protein
MLQSTGNYVSSSQQEAHEGINSSSDFAIDAALAAAAALCWQSC